MEHDPHFVLEQLYLEPFRPEPIADLKRALLTEFAGKNLKVADVIDQHTAKTRCLERNYKDALLELELEAKITIDPPADKRKKRNGKPTLADDKLVIFP
jgi:hypothetical protein